MSLEKDIKALVESMNLDLFDTAVVSENGETIFRVSVISRELENGKRRSLPLEKYVELTHLISPLLDVTPPVSGEYRLEVGSPGIEKKLQKIEQFSMSEGEDVSITLKDKTKIRAKISSVNGSTISLKSNDEELEVDFGDIVKAKTYFEW